MIFTTISRVLAWFLVIVGVMGVAAPFIIESAPLPSSVRLNAGDMSDPLRVGAACLVLGLFLGVLTEISKNLEK